MTARIILDSVTQYGDRLTTMEVTFHRFVLAEFNTHRVFSRNSASSRAIPLQKQIQRIQENLAVPVVWASEQKGMQGGDEIEEPDTAALLWECAADDAIASALRLQKLGVHKSIINRLLEPFMYHTVVVTSTEWQNFFDQRCSPLAQPEIRVAAEAMREAYDASTPEVRQVGEWHTPFIQPDEYDQLDREQVRKVSSARCARVSYLTHSGIRDPQEDLALFDRLMNASPRHWSPLEHVAVAVMPTTPIKGNLKGWAQYRHIYGGGEG